MIPIEACVLVLIVAFGMVGMSRTLPRELGATVGFVAMILGLHLVASRIGGVTSEGLTAAGHPMTQDMAAWLAITAIIAVTVFMVYQGETLSYDGITASGPVSKVLDFGVGLLNGWLVVGTWWYYTNSLGYPMSEMGLYSGPLSARAEHLVALTPAALIPDDRALIFLAAVMVGLVALKVAR
jgi:uncharacterized membrane protein required for colicin V production